MPPPPASEEPLHVRLRPVPITARSSVRAATSPKRGTVGRTATSVAPGDTWERLKDRFCGLDRPHRTRTDMLYAGEEIILAYTH